uniref:Uncharacterized protein n=1 Tax=Bionectria ochroleuca TaxID=29856 RepID=A0A0B7JNT1_BIOOC
MANGMYNRRSSPIPMADSMYPSFNYTCPTRAKLRGHPLLRSGSTRLVAYVVLWDTVRPQAG